MICLEITASGLQPITPQPSNYTTCTYVLQSGNEISAWPPLTTQQGVTISIAIGVCWATAYTFRVIGQFLKSNNSERE